nr:immunoglobulin light chain junction region [Macaca mulatta]
CQHYYRTPYSC